MLVDIDTSRNDNVRASPNRQGLLTPNPAKEFKKRQSNIIQGLGSDGFVKLKKKQPVSRPERNVNNSKTALTYQRFPKEKENDKFKILKYQQKPVMNSARKF
jgi:hypothetical protein